MWKSDRKKRQSAGKVDRIVGTESNPTKMKSGQIIINKKATEENLDKLIEINEDGLDKKQTGKTTTDGTDGGLLKGKPHYDENGNPTGGIPVIVDGNRNIEVEGEEFVVNAEASKEHWQELSKINQSTGNGVAIGPPNGANDDDPEEFSGGGKIQFNPNHIPNKWILSFAEKVRTKHPKVWNLGGNIFGNEAYKNLKRVADRGYWLDSEEWMYIKWQSYVARHKKDFRIAGVIAMLKWVDKVDRGWAYMKDLIEERIKKETSKSGWKHKNAPKMKDGGKTDNKSFVIFFKSNKSNELIYVPLQDSTLSLSEAIEVQKNLYSWMDIKWIKGFEVKNGEEKIRFFLEHIKDKWETKPDLSVKIENGQIVFYKGKDSVAFDVFVLFKTVSSSEKSITMFNRAHLIQGETDIIVDENFDFDRNKVFELILQKMKDGGRTVAQTPAPASDRIKGSEVNPKDSASSESKGKQISFDSKTNSSIQSLIQNHNKKYPSKKITIGVAKAVVRRGMGAYSSSHRPTISDGKPNDRTAWGLARLKAFIYKAQNGESKSGKYSQDNDLFEELDIAVDKYHLGGDMSKHLAPNGKPSNLTHEQWHLVRTPEFKSWFGDWENSPETASKVVDENGEPLVVYHGSKSSFNSFDKSKLGLTDKGWYGKGFYFSPTTKIPSYYGEVKEYFLNIRKPLDVNKQNPLYLQPIEVTDEYIKKGYDGASSTLDLDKMRHEYCVFYEFPNNIKLADGTNVTFDSNNPDIRYAEGGLIAPNGKKSNLTSEQYKLVRTPQFKSWFGDWENDPKNSSQVVDENGEPLVVYRGDSSASKKGNIFKTGFNRMGFISKSRLPNQYFHYFVDQYDVALSYAKNQIEDHNDQVEYTGKGKMWETKVTPYFLNIRKPIDITPNNKLYPTFQQFKDEYKKQLGEERYKRNEYRMAYDYGFEISYRQLNKIYANYLGNDYLENEPRWSFLAPWYKEQFETDYRMEQTYHYFIEYKDTRFIGDILYRFYNKMVEKQFDGLIFLERTHWDGGFFGENSKKYESGELKYNYKRWVEKPKVFAALESNQIKLADGSNITFDGENPDIRFDDGGMTNRPNKQSAVELDEKYGTSISKTDWKFPDNYTLEEVQNKIIYPAVYRRNFKDELRLEEYISKLNKSHFNYPRFNSLTDDDLYYILNGMVSGYNYDDIVYFIKDWDYKNPADQNTQNTINDELIKLGVDKSYLQWIISPKTFKKLKEQLKDKQHKFDGGGSTDEIRQIKFDIMRLQTKAFKTMPGSPRQKEIIKQIDDLYARLESLGGKFDGGGDTSDSNQALSKYAKRIEENLNFMHTPRNEWKSLPIIGFNEIEVIGKVKKMPIFEYPKNYSNAPTLYPSSKNPPYNCELCGQMNISMVYWIKNDTKKYLLGVGSECVKHFEEGKSGKENERSFKIAKAIILDNDMANLKKFIRDNFTRKENMGYGRTSLAWKSISTPSDAGHSFKEISDLKASGELDILYDDKKLNKFNSKDLIYTTYVYDKIPVFGYESSVKSGGQSIDKIEKDLLAWYSRNEKLATNMYEALVKVFKANKYDFDESQYEFFKDVRTDSPEYVSKMGYGGSADAPDTVTFDIPLLIRTLELAREDIKSDANLHRIVENLIQLKNKKVLTMDDYDYIVNIKKHTEKMKQGGTTQAQREKIAKVMREFKAHKLHSGSAHGPIVTDRDQAIAIALSEANASKYDVGGNVDDIMQGLNLLLSMSSGADKKQIENLISELKSKSGKKYDVGGAVEFDGQAPLSQEEMDRRIMENQFGNI